MSRSSFIKRNSSSFHSEGGGGGADSSIASISSSTTPRVIPVGLDLGSLHARIAISNPVVATPVLSSSSEEPVPVTTSSSSSIPSVISNELGDRYTLAMYAVEDDHYDGDESTSTTNTTATPRFIFGDAARRTLHRRKLLTDSFHIQHVLKQSSSLQEEQERKQAMMSFFSHVITLTSHATSMHPSTLRWVLSVPASLVHDSTFLTNLYTSVEQGTIQAMRTIGWDNHPALVMNPNTSSSSSTTTTKKDKKKKIQELETTDTECIVQVISEPMAVLIAHGYLDGTISPSPTLSIMESSSTTHWKWALIIDWGASSLKISLLENIAFSTTPTPFASSSSPLVSIQTHTEYPQYAGNTLSQFLVQHVAQTFQTSRRIRESILDNYKVKARIQVAVEEVVRTFCKGSSNQAWIALDGLYEGMDCHMSIPAQRWDLIMSNVLNSVESLLASYTTYESMIVLTSGCMVCHPAITSMMDRVFNPKIFPRGKSRDVIPPEEAIAMGCSMYATSVCSPLVQRLLKSSRRLDGGVDDEETEESKGEGSSDGMLPPVLVQDMIHLSPICIAFSTQLLDGQETRVDTLIPVGSPLPCHVVYTVEHLDHIENMSLVQLVGNEDTNGKVLCRLQKVQQQQHVMSGLPWYITVMLSNTGELSIAIQDDSPVIIK